MNDLDKREIAMIMAETVQTFGRKLASLAESHHRRTARGVSGHGALHASTVYLIMSNISIAALQTADAMRNENFDFGEVFADNPDNSES